MRVWLVPECCMAYLQYFGAGLAALGVCGVIASIVSPDQGGIGTVAVGVVLLCVGIAVLVLAGRKASG
ncbi:hypothetical protein C7S10_12080 [Nocardioides currus]|uniref:Uncharacterized protein n=2 Tax=Nocardioides currus TaxID=2133958 RepID=A0A2R7YVR3_9ACTN|nr:hypothetical protein C7S10_12080 [Nocardioides currus]